MSSDEQQEEWEDVTDDIPTSAKHQFTLFNFRLLFHTFTICNYFKPIYFYLEKPCDEYPKVAKSTKSTKMRLQENET